jgi:DNA invertase Pin-like site-specific DNA recombinase
MRDPRVTSNHLSRDAYLYIRQSTLRQVSENGESTRRQYALRERAPSLGWPQQRVHVIHQDLDASSEDRLRSSLSSNT